MSGIIKGGRWRQYTFEGLMRALPETVKKIAVLDITKEPGSVGEPLYLDIVAALNDKKDITIIGGRYGLSSKEFTPSMVKAVYDHLEGKCIYGFTVGINDDVITNTSIAVRKHIDFSPDGTIDCKFWGFGSGNTVGANKNSIKIIGNNTNMYVQGYFQYDAEKSAGVTRSHLRFGKAPIQSEYLVESADFIALHNQAYIGHYDILEGINDNGVFLLNSSWSPEDAFFNLTEAMQKVITEKHVKFYNINALKIARSVGLGGRINTVMEAAFFATSGVLEKEEAIKLIRDYIKKTYMKKDGNGPARANSLFEDNAEYGLWMRLGVESYYNILKENVEALLKKGTDAELAEALKYALENWDSANPDAKTNSTKIKSLLPKVLENPDTQEIVQKIIELQSYFIQKSIWCIGGDGWACDIGYGGLDHVLASGININVLVLDIEIYSNTGGQASKATPMGAVARFAESGKKTAKKELGKMMMIYEYIYVASVAMGANKNQLIKALKEAEAYKGPSIVVAYAPCIGHGINMSMTQKEQKRPSLPVIGYFTGIIPNLKLKVRIRSFLIQKNLNYQYEIFLKGETRYTVLEKTFLDKVEEFRATFNKHMKERYEEFKEMAENK